MAEESPWRLRFEDPEDSFDMLARWPHISDFSVFFVRKEVESFDMRIKFSSDRTIRRITFLISDGTGCASALSIDTNLPLVRFEDMLDLDIVRGPVETKARGMEAYLEHGYDPDNPYFCRVCGKTVKPKRHFFSFTHFFRHHYSGRTIKSASKA